MVAGSSQIPCCHIQTPAVLGCPTVAFFRPKLFRPTADRRLCPTTVCQAKGQSYHVEVEVNEDEDPEGVYKRFRNSCNLSGMVYEARRRKHFENTQDIKKRKQQEKGLRKMRDARERFLVTYEDAHTDTPPFTDLFAGEDDMYDILGDMPMPMDEAAKQEKIWSNEDYLAVKSLDALDIRGRQNGAPQTGRSTVNSSVRSIPSQGPQTEAQKKELTNKETNGKTKAKVQTARTRRAAKLQAKKREGAKPASS